MTFEDGSRITEKTNLPYAISERLARIALVGGIIVGSLGLVACAGEEADELVTDSNSEQVTATMMVPETNTINDIDGLEPRVEIPDSESPGRLVNNLLTNLQNAVNTGNQEYLEFFALDTNEGSAINVARELMSANSGIPDIYNTSGDKRITLTPEILTTDSIDLSGATGGQTIVANVIEEITTYGNTPLPVVDETSRQYKLTVEPTTIEYIKNGEKVVSSVWLVKELYVS